jgi:hypothetical protein
VLFVADEGNDRIVTLRKVDSSQVQLAYNAYDWDEEFIGGGLASGAIGERGWTLAGSGTLSIQASTAANPGLLRLTTGATANNNLSISLGPWLLPQIDSMLFIFIPGTVSGGNVREGVGMGAGLRNAAPTDGVSVERDTTTFGGGFLGVAKYINGVRTGVLTTVPYVAGAPYLAEFTRTAPGEVTVRIEQLLPLGGGVVEEVVMTGIRTTVALNADFFIRCFANASRSMDPDYWQGSFSGLRRA